MEFPWADIGRVIKCDVPRTIDISLSLLFQKLFISPQIASPDGPRDVMLIFPGSYVFTKNCISTPPLNVGVALRPIFVNKM